MMNEHVIYACTSDVAGKVRGKGFPASEFDKRLKRGIGWTPTNVQITCFDVIGESPFGSLGDLVLIPDAATKVSIRPDNSTLAEDIVLGDIHQTDGTPWDCCTRSILKGALARLEKVAGLTLVSTFEHEFQFKSGGSALGTAFTLSGYRKRRQFAEMLIAVMRSANLDPDTILKEFGDDQYEVTMAPQKGIASADKAVILREMIHAVAAQFGEEVTFTPLRDPKGVGNGVHIHMSFLDGDGKPATYDANGRHMLTKPAAQFIAGALKYLDSYLALVAPSVISYSRLTPHRWSAAYNNLGLQDREASVRICPVSSMSDIDRARQFNFEFRAADATASPYLQLAAIIHAGVQGIEEGLEVPDTTAEDLSLLPEDVLAARGLQRLPTTLSEALQRFTQNDVVKSWFTPRFVEVYEKHKHAEMAFLENKTEAEICTLYETVY